MMAVAGWRIWCCPSTPRRNLALTYFGMQLTLNFLWSPVFFNLHRIQLALGIIVSLAITILLFMLTSWKLDRNAALLFIPYFLWVSFASGLNYTIGTMNPSVLLREPELPTAYASLVKETLDEQGFPGAEAWSATPPVNFDRDWQGHSPDPQRSTEVQLLWNAQTLFVRFAARYREITVFADAREDGWRDQLWDRDVVETFLQPDVSDPLKYKELEISPNGFWIDLAISHGEKEELYSKLQRRVRLDEPSKTWVAELAIPLSSLTKSFDRSLTWRVNFFRVEGKEEPRFYSAWSPTHTPQPNFHVPSCFGFLIFR